MKNSPYFLILCALISIGFTGQTGWAQDKSKVNLDPILTFPEALEMTPAKLEKTFLIGQQGKKKLYSFKWLTKNKDRAIFLKRPFGNVRLNLSIFKGQVPVEEAIVDFKDGKYLGTTISIYNRGDGGARGGSGISREDFNERFKVAGQEIGTLLDIRPKRREANPKKGMLTSGWIWISGRGMAVLEHNPEAPDKIEYLRMRLARRDAKGVYSAAMDARAGAAVRLSDLPGNVEKDKEGNVFVTGIPMVDQGQKGYCVVASAQRLFEYYGIPCDQHQLAQIAQADPNAGTSLGMIDRELGQIDHLFKTRFETLLIGGRGGVHEIKQRKYIGDQIDLDAFKKVVRKYIDDGIPLLWALGLGQFPEEPPVSPQTRGGHMRMIIGYNDKTNRIIFSDSWGAGHEFKTMAMDHTYKATHGIFVMQPITR